MKITPELPLRILTHNIRYATSSPFKGERPWPERKQLLINELLYNTRHQDTFICLQEVLHNQLVDILSGLNSATPTSSSPSPQPQPQPQPQHAHPHVPPNPAPAKETSDTDPWTYIGVGRDDGHQRGEYSAIFYRPDTWTVQHWETVWLSETPTKPSKSWDAASIRIVTIGVFRHRVSGQSVLAMSTHLDDQGTRSRLEAARIILRKIDEFLPPSSSSSSAIYGDVNGGYDISGVFLAGDFNSQDFQEAYVELTKKGSPLADAAKLVPPALHYGNTITWTGFGYEGQDPTRIDYVLLGGRKTGAGSSAVAKQPWKLEGYAVLPNKYDDGVYNSDHRAVVVDARLLSD